MRHIELRFSVILPTAERPSLLHEALSSVLEQTVRDFEVLVVDDGGTVELSIPNDERIRLVRRDRRGGPAAARNTGLQHARGRYVCFLDDDDLYSPDRLEVAARFLERAPLVVTWAKYVGEDATRGRVLEGWVHDVILDGTTPPVGTVAVRRDLVVPFDETLVAIEDVEWWLRQAHVCPVVTAPAFTYLVRRHEGPRDGYGTEARIRCSLQLLDRHREYFDSHPKARAFRWKRIGLMRLAVSDRRGAREAFARSLSARPSVRTTWHLLRSTVGMGTRPASTRSGEEQGAGPDARGSAAG